MAPPTEGGSRYVPGRLSARSFADRGVPPGLDRPFVRPYKLDDLIAPTTARRLRSLAKHEARSPEPRLASPAWAREEEIPGLIIAQRYSGGDAFGISRQSAELDLAFRRAAALIRLLEAGEQVTSWPRPMRPARGGLWLLDARYGSLDALYTVYGALVTVAMSQPVSLASFASLAWTASKSATRLASRWIVRVLHPSELTQRPSAGDLSPAIAHDDDFVLDRMTKRLLPFFREAVNDGRGLDFRATGASGEVRIIVTPRNSENTEAEQ
jgi:hypothetical protein